MSTGSHLSSSALAEVVRLRPFRRLWLVFGLSSLGDWLGLLATSSFASGLMRSTAAQGATFGAIIAVQLLPSLVLGPVAGVLADRFDRRRTMVAIDVARFLLYASIPAAGQLVHRQAVVVAWAAAASFAVQAGAMLWTPAKEAAVPNLLPKARLETANQLTIITTYGITPVLAALAFAAVTSLPGLGRTDAAAVALYFDALTFLASAAVVFFGVPEISGRRPATTATESSWTAIRTGVRHLLGTPMLRGLLAGLLGAFAGAGVVVGGARFYSRSLGGGDASFWLLFAGLFVGFGLGVLAGPRLAGTLSRRLLFGLSVQLAGFAVVLLAMMPRLGGALPVVVLTGFGSGSAFLCGVTLIGADVDDAVRGRVFAFVQTSARVMLLLAVAASSTLAGLGVGSLVVLGPTAVPLSASRILYFLAGMCGIAVGAVAVRQMTGHTATSLWHAARTAHRSSPATAAPPDQDHFPVRGEDARRHGNRPPAGHDQLGADGRR
ncbi:MFS transporter [Actinoplanes sp. NPDC020271]|uniref:MFS transporter n=1 Tax=Actinoplanes sp. NPDC020271 TaxID=3363896 RepID=UPI00379A6517